MFSQIVAGYITLLAVLASVALAEPVVRTWGSLVEQDSAAKSLLLYCDVISASQSDCASKFLGVDDGAGGSSAVARGAAATCLESQGLATTALMNMFNLDAQKMSRYANGATLDAPPKNTHWGWSDAARDEAAKKAFAASAKESSLRRQIEHSADQWDKIFKEQHGNPEGSIVVAELIIDAGLAIWAASKARDDPFSMAVAPDQLIPDQQPPGANLPPAEAPPANQPPPQESDNPNPVPEGVPITSETTFEGDVADVDLSDDIQATPILQDETTRTAMQRCQESEEAKMWKQIGSTEIDPNADMGESDKDQAERLRLYGICDKEYYGEATCAEWRKTLDVTPASPEVQASIDQYTASHPVCPINLVSESDCHKAQQEVFKHYAIPDVEVGTVKSLFTPGKPIPWLPRTDLGLGQVQGDLKPAMPVFKTKKDAPNLFSPDGAFIPLKPRPESGRPGVPLSPRDEL